MDVEKAKAHLADHLRILQAQRQNNERQMAQLRQAQASLDAKIAELKTLMGQGDAGD